MNYDLDYKKKPYEKLNTEEKDALRLDAEQEAGRIMQRHNGKPAFQFMLAKILSEMADIGFRKHYPSEPTYGNEDY